MGDKRTFAGRNPSSDSPINTPPLGIRSIFRANHDYRDLFNFSQSEDFGRESLGIFDFSQESLSFLRDDAGRESLGIINLDSLDTGRESLGITNIKTYDFVLSKGSLPPILDENEPTTNVSTLRHSESVPNSNSFEIPRVKISQFENPELYVRKSSATQDTLSFLNDAFLKQPLSSIGSTVSSLYPTFNSSSLNSSLPSRISSCSESVDVMNDAFADTTDFAKRMQLYVRFPASLTSPVHNRMNTLKKAYRIGSLPAQLETKQFNFEELPLSQQSFNNLDEVFLDNCSDDAFNDSVFIEGKHVAEKIADLSLLKQSYILDETQEPAEFANILDGEEPTCDTETVFKTIDKLFVSSQDENLLKSVNKTPLQHENVNTPRRTSSTSSTSKSKDPIEMIGALSDILNDDNRDAHKKHQGQNILANLAEYFHSSGSTRSRSCILDDSGHSSIESVAATVPDGDEVFEVLDLRKKCQSETNISQVGEEVCVPLDLSTKSKSTCDKSFTSPKILPPKFNKTRHNSLTNMKVNHGINQSGGSNCSASSNESRYLGDASRKFKPKKCEGKVSSFRRGPMKAVLPVDTMAKAKGDNLKLTPRNEPSTSKLKKTSTPINETNLRPIGQSTPDNPKNVFVTSPVARPNLSAYSGSRILKPRVSTSGTRTSFNKSSDSESKPISSVKRRTYSTELVKTQTSKKTLIRSQSTDEKLKVSTRWSPQRSSLIYSKTHSKVNVLKENTAKGNRQSLPIKKLGKENLKY